jgi:DNA-binding NarL/FixJ family response regulator
MLKLTKPKKSKARILIVNPYHEAHTNGGAEFDEGEYKIVGLYKDLVHASLSLPRTRPEILVVTVPPEADESFLEMLWRIRKTNLSLQFIMLTDRLDYEFIFELMSIGISSILPSATKWAEIADHLERIHYGQAFIAPGIAKAILDSLKLNPIPELSRRQLQILKLMFMGMTASTISEKLTLSTETTRTHVKNIYKKLNVNSREEALKKAISERIIFFNM